MALSIKPGDSSSRRRPRPLVLLILDGWGISERHQGNAIHQAKTPNIDDLSERFPYTTLDACGEAVGLPPGQMGNSEAGHLNIGAGRVIYQDLSRINRSIDDGSFFQNAVLTGVCQRVKDGEKTLHLMGLVSDGGVHSHLSHVGALLRMANKVGVPRVLLHTFLDGRDTPPQSAFGYLQSLTEMLKPYPGYEIATVMGRYFAMDRDNRWERTQSAYGTLVYGRGLVADNVEAAVQFSYDQGMTDEFVRPSVLQGVLEKRDTKGRLIGDRDGLIFFNFRADRARQLTKAFILEDFEDFERGGHPPATDFVAFSEYDPAFDCDVAFPSGDPQNVLGQVLSVAGLRQLRLAETEKYAHVTSFFNGRVEAASEGEERRLIPSPEVPTYDLKPEMSAELVTQAALEAIESDDFDVIIMNYANLDMVGHTGLIEAAIKAAETIDPAVRRVVEAVLAKGGVCLVTADHGDAEQMTYESGKTHTAHTCNPVPFIYIADHPAKLRSGGILADIAPTMLDLLGIEVPKEMTGKPLIEKT